MSAVLSFDPRTGEQASTGPSTSTPADVEDACRRAVAASAELAALPRDRRAAFLDACADALDAHRDAIVPIADSETALGVPRLEGELRRTTYQLRLFADAVREGGFLEATIDHAGDTPMGPRPDLRRMLVPIGPVAVFGSSNFPLAFSVPGGDTASALAAGCAVVVKAHSAHPRTAAACLDAFQRACAATGVSADTVQLVFGRDAGVTLVAHHSIRAVGFTGSLTGGKALLDVIAGRDEPIPFYGELSGLNPFVVTPGAAAEQGERIADELFLSFTNGAGQFCTKPGLAFVPVGREGDSLVARLRASVEADATHHLLTEGISRAYAEGREQLGSAAGVEELAHGSESDEGFSATTSIVGLAARDLTDAVAQECFGPVTVVARYDDLDDLVRALTVPPSSLTTTIRGTEAEREFVARVVEVMHDRTGRFVFEGVPTGVAVSWAQHHGGPWPSTNSLHTSVGVTSVRRWLRPLAWQSAPASLLPEELRDGPMAIPRRIDGVLVASAG
jgi:NADP-dependent aldehyde dehydrogenase